MQHALSSGHAQAGFNSLIVSLVITARLKFYLFQAKATSDGHATLFHILTLRWQAYYYRSRQPSVFAVGRIHCLCLSL